MDARVSKCFTRKGKFPWLNDRDSNWQVPSDQEPGFTKIWILDHSPVSPDPNAYYTFSWQAPSAPPTKRRQVVTRILAGAKAHKQKKTWQRKVQTTSHRISERTPCTVLAEAHQIRTRVPHVKCRSASRRPARLHARLGGQVWPRRSLHCPCVGSFSSLDASQRVWL